MDSGFYHVQNVLRSLDEENAKRISEGKPCQHRYEWHPGTKVEMGMDSGYFCRRCGEEK